MSAYVGVAARWGRQHTFAVIAEAHLGLAEADGVLALADPVELFELGLLDTLRMGC